MKHRFFIFALFIFYMILMTVIMMWQGLVIPPSRYLFVLLLGGLLVKRARSFIFDWIPFVFILISYDYLRGVVPSLIPKVHFEEMAQIDWSIFHTLPTAQLQKALFHPLNLAWYDYLGTLLYFFHFILPVSFGFLLWINNKNHFRQFVTGFSLLSYASFATYLIFPAASPWVAAQAGLITGVTKVMNFTLPALFGGSDVITIYHNMNPNPVAAIPSMHAALPFVILLFSVRMFKIKGLLFLPYVLAIWFFIIYFGEHYVFDVFLGAIYALTSYTLSTMVLHRINWQVPEQKFIQRLPWIKVFRT